MAARFFPVQAMPRGNRVHLCVCNDATQQGNDLQAEGDTL